MSHPLLKVADRRLQKIDLSLDYPAIGVVFIRSLTVGEKSRYELGNREKYGSPEWAKAEETRVLDLLVLTVCDEHGTPALTPLDTIDLANQDGRLIQIIVEAASRHCGLTLSKSIFEAIENAEKKSVTIG